MKGGKEKMKGPGTIAPLKNVGLCVKALEGAIQRQESLPGMVVFYGHSGYGKSFAAAYTGIRHDCYYVECRSTWTRKAVLEAILKDMAITPARTTYGLTEQVSERLATSGKPLIIDEMDHIVEHGAVEIVRDIYEGSGVPILMIGEEKLPEKLTKWERFHGRILDFVGALPADMEDTRTLAKFYAKDIEISDDLHAALTEAARGSIRRICVNLARFNKAVLAGGSARRIDLASWMDSGRGFWTGDVVARKDLPR
jgi:DNA transposition AAA+ family ATPase